VGYNTTLGDHDIAKEFAEFFVISDSELQVSGYNTVLLVIACSIACEFENLSSKVFEDGGEVDWCTSTYTLCVVALLQQTVDTTDGELETGFGRARLRLAFTTRSLAALGFAANFARHY